MHIRGETTFEKLAIDFDVDRDWKVPALVGVIGPYAGGKWLGANVENRLLGYLRSN
jgi:hypothetical protein